MRTPWESCMCVCGRFGNSKNLTLVMRQNCVFLGICFSCECVCVCVLVMYTLPSSYEGCCTFINCPQTTECTLCSSTCTFVCMHVYLMRGKCGEVYRHSSWNWIWDLLRGGWDKSSSLGVSGVDGHHPWFGSQYDINSQTQSFYSFIWVR